MTSSLVGSEMCIRDSLEEDDTSLPVLQYDSVEGQSYHHRSCPSSSSTSVSYTHLTLPTICSV
eukprot:465375-Prorocentrum_lima.AAC.1